MDLSAKKLAVGAVRLATMSCFGPLAGGLFVAGGAVAARILAESEFGKTLGDMAMHLASDKASELFGVAMDRVGKRDRDDFEKPMRLAALNAIEDLKSGAPAGFKDWFEAWRDYLTRRPASEIFAGSGDRDPAAVEYDDSQFRDLWWNRMEPVLLRWNNAERLSITQELPVQLGQYLREELPQALRKAHEEVLRDPEMERSWKAFQQGFMRDTTERLDRIEKKLDGKASAAAASPVWNIPAPAQHFQDRPDLITRIDQALEQGATALTALHGLAGIGKTQLARGYAQQRKDRYKLGAWIEAETTESLMTSLSALAPLLGVPAEQNQQAMVARVMNELSARAPYLVIFDNAESAENIREYVENLSGGHLLITSRSQNWDDLAKTVGVTEWSVKESVRFLLQRTRQQDRASAEALAQDLDGLVLALEHAASYMNAGDRMALAEYRRVWKEKLRWVSKGHAYPASVAASLGLSLDAVATESSMASSTAYELLCIFAWLAPDRIPKKELLEAGAEELPEALKQALGNHDQWTGVIETLRKYSLLRREQVEGVVTGYALHRLVQEVVRERIGSDQERAKWFASACGLVSAAFQFQPGEPEFWPVCEVLLPHARAIKERAAKVAAPASLGHLLNQAGVYLRNRGLYAEARDFLELALESGLRQLGPDHRDVATGRSNLANVLRDLGEHEEARKQIQMALESDLRQFGPDHPSVAIRRSNLAIVLRNLGEYAEARKQAEMALESDLRQFGPDHPRVAIRRSNLANVLGDLGQDAEARKQIELALESDLRQLRPDHLRIAIRRLNLAAILHHLGEKDAALREIDQALAIFRKVLAPEHPDIRKAERWRRIILGATGAAGA